MGFDISWMRKPQKAENRNGSLPADGVLKFSYSSVLASWGHIHALMGLIEIRVVWGYFLMKIMCSKAAP